MAYETTKFSINDINNIIWKVRKTCLPAAFIREVKLHYRRYECGMNMNMIYEHLKV